jgi:hypothetical protein
MTKRPRPRYRGNITQIPPTLREELDRELIDRNFSDYTELTDWLNQRLEQNGLEISLSRSSVHRYGKRFEERVEMLELASRQAEKLKSLFSDEGANLSEMALQLCQGLMFNLMMESGEKLEPKELSMMTRSLAEATRGFVNVKKYQQEVKDRAEAAARAVAAQARSGGLSEETIAQIEQQILGIASL